jgi:membrane associated rhomboid family serine protease
VTTILFLAVVLALAFYMTTAEERARFARVALSSARQVKNTVARRDERAAPFRNALHARTRWVLVTPALIGVSATIFVCMLFGDGTLGDRETLIAWGGGFGPRTTNGEWWRLVTAMFVHSGMLQLVANLAALISLGFILERLVGHFAFASVYMSAGILASVVTLSEHPVSVSVGASGAICGLYGLMLAASMWGLLRRSTLTIPLIALKELAPVAAVFVLYNVVTGGFDGNAAFSGVLMGLIGGLVLTRRVRDRKPAARWVAATVTGTIVIVVAMAVPHRGIADVPPEIRRVMTVEDRTASAYQAAVARFRMGRISAEALAGTIERTIEPELRTAHARLTALDRVPREHQPLVAGAEAYLLLREKSWRLRAEALHKASMIKLHQADMMERASLEAFAKIRDDAN